ncbi:putative germin-like protein 2-1 [Tanacetum coccineum]
MALVFGLLVILALVVYVAMASEPSPLQDFCVAGMNSQVLVNGFACKDPSLVQADDFYFDGQRMMGNTSNPVGSKVTPAFVQNTLGISMARVDNVPGGRCFRFPKRLVHFQRNIGKTNARAVSGLSSQNPGIVTIANAVFGSKPDISIDILAKAFQTNNDVISTVQVLEMFEI